MLRQVLSGDFSIYSLISYVISSIFIILFILPLHECAHGFAAYKLGDPTAKGLRRLTLNPLAHIDWFGSAAIVFFGFGWAKPVPVNMRYFRNPKRDMAITALAGPLSNLLAAFVGTFLFNLFLYIFIETGVLVTAAASIVLDIFRFFAIINVSLAVFNLIPIPPLDGSRILTAFLPNRIYYRLMQYEQIFSLVLIVLVLGGSFSNIIGEVSNTILGAFDYITKLPFGF